MPTQPNPIAPEQQQQPAPDENRYWAFISYRHHDKPWANWLHREIERYGIPGIETRFPIKCRGSVTSLMKAKKTSAHLTFC